MLKDSEQMVPRTQESLRTAVLALEDLVVSPSVLSQIQRMPPLRMTRGASHITWLSMRLELSNQPYACRMPSGLARGIGIHLSR